MKWFIEGDIKGFFDNINHATLIGILRERINDERFLRLVRKFLNAGYIENWTFHNTYSGTPQGGIISPILANIYLDKFDKYVNEYVRKFKKGKKRMRTKEYRRNEVELSKARIALKNANDDCERENAIARIRQLEKERVNIPPSDPMDNNYARLVYVRYADDWLCGVIGSKEDCKKIKEDFKNFLKEQLQLELSEEKTLITNAQKSAKFLSYEIGTGNGGIISQLKMQNEMKLTDESWISYQQGKGNEEYQKYMEDLTDMQNHVLPYLQSFCSLEEKGVKERREQQVTEKNESREAVSRAGVEANTAVKDAGKAERKPVAQKRAMTGKEKKPSIHERLEINKKIIQEKQGKDKLERGADLGVR